jgi:hypothetical protein
MPPQPTFQQLFRHQVESARSTFSVDFVSLPPEWLTANAVQYLTQDIPSINDVTVEVTQSDEIAFKVRETPKVAKRCSSCGSREDVDRPLYADPFNDGNVICDACGINRRGVQDWNFVPDYYVYRKIDKLQGLVTQKKDLLFGFELEIEDQRPRTFGSLPSRNEVIWDISKEFPWLFGKHDGSLSHGFEIVSMPLSWDFLAENIPFLQGRFEQLSSAGWRAFQTKTCGMHVHLSKASFSRLHLFKFLELFYSDPFFIFMVSQRGRFSKMQRWASLTPSESLAEMATSKRQRTDKYTAVNLRHCNSVEIRIFRGTLSIQGFMKNMEFCKALYDFTREVPLKDLSVKNFILYILKSEKQYPYLWKFFKENKELQVYCRLQEQT